ncbi:MAG: hypothetical protein ACI4PX_01085, partial [Ruminococcus sp.]
MTSESYITKLYFKKYFLIFFPIAVLISTIGLVLCFTLLKGSYLPLFILLCIACTAVSVVIPLYFAHDDKIKGKKASDIFRAEGFTCNFCDTYRKIYVDKG